MFERPEEERIATMAILIPWSLLGVSRGWILPEKGIRRTGTGMRMIGLSHFHPKEQTTGFNRRIDTQGKERARRRWGWEAEILGPWP